MRGLVDLAQHHLRVGDADRERSQRRPRRIETEQRVERFAEFFANQIVEREVESRARRGGDLRVQQRFEVEGIVAGERMRLEIRNDALNRLPVPFDRRGLADTLEIGGTNADDCGARDCFFTARDLEEVYERKLHRAGRDRERRHRPRTSWAHRLLPAWPSESEPLDSRWYGRGARLRLARSERRYRTDLYYLGSISSGYDGAAGSRCLPQTGARAAPTCENAGSYRVRKTLFVVESFVLGA